jgi:uncharacterized protein YqgV (UPF0045/DUF77 family)
MDVITQCYRALEADCNRITCTVKIDARKGKSDPLTSKVESVQRRLGRALKT